MITIRALEKALLNAVTELNLARAHMAHGEDLKPVTDDAKQVSIRLYEFLCKFQGQEEYGRGIPT